MNLASNQTALVRSRGRVWLLAPPATPHTIKCAAAKSSALSVRRLDGAADRAALRRLYGRLHTSVGAEQRSDGELADWLERGLALGRLLAFDVTPDLLLQTAELDKVGPTALSFPGGMPGVTGWSPRSVDRSTAVAARQRCAEVLLRACGQMEPSVRAAFESFLIPQTFTQATACLWRWAGYQAESLAPIFDPRLFSVAYQMSGWAAFEGLDYLAQSAERAVSALSDDDLDESSRLFALAVQTLGARTYFLIATLGSRWEPNAADDHDSILLRWSAYLDTVILTPIEAMAGAVWGDLSPRGAAAAVTLARQANRTTFEGVLGRHDFQVRYLAEFPARFSSALTRQIWDMASLRYVRQLRGRVRLYIEAAVGPPADRADLEGRLTKAGGAKGLAALSPALDPAVSEVEFVNVHAPIQAVVLGPGQFRR